MTEWDASLSEEEKARRNEIWFQAQKEKNAMTDAVDLSITFEPDGKELGMGNYALRGTVRGLRVNLRGLGRDTAEILVNRLTLAACDGMNPQERQWLLAECAELDKLIEETPEADVIDRMSLQARKETIEAALAAASS